MDNLRGTVFFDVWFHPSLDINPFLFSLVVSLVFPKPEFIFHKAELPQFGCQILVLASKNFINDGSSKLIREAMRCLSFHSSTSNQN
ncbi:hypothetical protein GNE10_28550 [Nostoc sp. 2RC]|nr:hypothetical protein [Nostoc sp. 2RC]